MFGDDLGVLQQKSFLPGSELNLEILGFGNQDVKD